MKYPAVCFTTPDGRNHVAYFTKTLDEAKTEVQNINTIKPVVLRNGHLAHCNKYYYYAAKV